MRVFIIIILVNFYTIVNCQNSICLLHSEAPENDVAQCMMNGTLVENDELDILDNVCEKSKEYDLSSHITTIKIRNNTIIDSFFPTCESNGRGQFAWISKDSYSRALKDTNLIQTSNVYLIAKPSKTISNVSIDDYCIYQVTTQKCEALANESKLFDMELDVLAEREPIRYEIHNITYSNRQMMKKTEWFTIGNKVLSRGQYYHTNYTGVFNFTLNNTYALNLWKLRLTKTAPVLLNGTTLLDNEGHGVSRRNKSKTTNHFIDTDADFTVIVIGRKRQFRTSMTGNLLHVFNKWDSYSSVIEMNGTEVIQDYDRNVMQYLFVFKEGTTAKVYIICTIVVVVALASMLLWVLYKRQRTRRRNMTMSDEIYESQD